MFKTLKKVLKILGPGVITGASDDDPSGSSGIARAFARDAALSDDDINVSANDGHVTISSSVETWSERDMAEDVAWRSPGVRSVTNNILVLAE